MKMYLNSYVDFQALVAGVDPAAKVFYRTIGEDAYTVNAFLTTSHTSFEYSNDSGPRPDLAANFPAGVALTYGISVHAESIETFLLSDFVALAGALSSTTKVFFFVDTDNSIQAYSLVADNEYVISLVRAASQNPPTAAEVLAAIPTAVQLTTPIIPDPE
jgi:hypothetical protein